MSKHASAQLLRGIVDTAVEAGSHLQHLQRLPIFTTRKSGFDIVTNADTTAEALIRQRLQALAPDVAFLGEESEGQPSPAGRSYWIVDPVDGTVNFARGLPWYGVSIALKTTAGTVAGVARFPALRQTLEYSEERGAFFAGRRVAVSQTSRLADAVITVMLTSHYDVATFEKAERAVRVLGRKTRGVRILVSGAYEGAMVACGRLDALVSLKNDRYSLAACIPAVRYSGGQVTDRSGNYADEESETLVVSNGRLHLELLDALNES